MKTFEIELNELKADVNVEFTNVLPFGYGHYSVNGFVRYGDCLLV